MPVLQCRFNFIHYGTLSKGEQTILDECTASLPQFIPWVDSKLELITLIPYEVEAILSSHQVGKAAGPDHINNRLLKELSHSLSFPLCELFNFSLASGKMPNLWKLAKCNPNFEKG